MRVKEVRRRCGITKKALDYYEEKGLVRPRVLENGYRDYSEKDLTALKEILVLRQCGLGIEEIRMVQSSSNKGAALQKCRYLLDIRAERLNAGQARLDSLARDYDIEGELDRLRQQGEPLCTVKERLALAFPGGFGVFVALHFGRFLQQPVDTEEKRRACDAIVGYLDNVTLHIDRELQAYMEEALAAGEKVSAARLEEQTHSHMQELLDDPRGYLEEHRDEIRQYLEYRHSDAFRQSHAGRLRDKLLEFQKSSGYEEIFLKNMKLLSPDYAAYAKRLEEADRQFTEQFPSWGELYRPAGPQGQAPGSRRAYR